MYNPVNFGREDGKELIMSRSPTEAAQKKKPRQQPGLFP
jgi:hypothetical protein